MSQIHKTAVIEESAQLADDVVVGPNCFVDEGTSIGSGTILEANVVIGKNVTMGCGNRCFPGSTIGTAPQILGLGPDSEFGTLSIGDNNVIREQATIHPSMYPGQKTVIGNQNMLMIGVHIGHDSVLEDNIVMSNYVQISGHCKIGCGVWLSGMVLLHQFVTIGKWAYAAGMAGINHDVPPFMIVSGHYPPRIRGINKRGLSRAGLDGQQQQSLFKAYKKLYRGDLPLLKAAEAMNTQGGQDENVRAVLEVILNSSKHRFGRYLETFRD